MWYNPHSFPWPAAVSGTGAGLALSIYYDLEDRAHDKVFAGPPVSTQGPCAAGGFTATEAGRFSENLSTVP